MGRKLNYAKLAQDYFFCIMVNEYDQLISLIGKEKSPAKIKAIIKRKREMHLSCLEATVRSIGKDLGGG